MLHTFIFDLDGTTVNSAHRLGDGSLSDWRRMNRPENIMQDKTLPLAEQLRQAIRDGLDVVILTSRVLGTADKVWLAHHGMMAPLILSRHPSDTRPAGEYKLAKMAELAVRKKMTFADLRDSVVLWDDDADVQQTLRGAGFRVIDPVQYNQRNEAA
jgi:FMN phosphatase YigB (HAD superfamily)